MARNNETFGRVSTPSAGGSGAATTVFGGTINPVAQQRMNQRQLGGQLRDPGEPGLLGQEPHDPNQIIIGDDWPGEPLDTPQPQTPEMARVSALRHAAFRTGAELSLLSGLETVKARTFGNPDLDDSEAVSRFRQNAALLTRDAVDGMARAFGSPEDGLEMPTRAVLEDIVEGVASDGARTRARALEEKALDVLEAGADDLLAQIRSAPDLAEGYAHHRC